MSRTLAYFRWHTDRNADNLKATSPPMRFSHGDVDGVRLDHIAEMFRRKGDEIISNMRLHSPSRLAILPDTTHVALLERMSVSVPLITEKSRVANPRLFCYAYAIFLLFILH